MAHSTIFPFFAFVCAMLLTAYGANTPGGGYGGYTMKCPGNANPLAGPNNQPKPCQDDQACGPSHTCQKNPVRGQPGVCCPVCPNGGPPMIGPNNATVPCKSDQECAGGYGGKTSAYFCPAAVQGGYKQVCCPKCPNGAEPVNDPATNQPKTCQGDGGYGGCGQNAVCVAPNPTQPNQPKVCCPLCPEGGTPIGDGTNPKTCDSDQACAADGSAVCTANVVPGKPKVCCPVCVAGGAPLQGQDKQPTVCETDQCCNSPAYYCSKNPFKPDTKLCCPQCPCGSPPLMGTDNNPLPCETDQCCSDPNYYCFAANITGKPNVCCPKPGGGPPQPQPEPEPEPSTTTAGYAQTPSPQPQPEPAQTTPAYAQTPSPKPQPQPPSPPAQTTPPTGPTPPEPQPEPEPGPGPGPEPGPGPGPEPQPAGTTPNPGQPTPPGPPGTTTGYASTPGGPTIASPPARDVVSPGGKKSWASMFSDYKKANPSFAIPPADGFRPNHGQAVPTSGQFKTCTKNADCYNNREPNEWCKSMPEYNWVGEGCVCVKEAKKASCIITREKVSTKQKQWTFCQSETTFKCQ